MASAKVLSIASRKPITPPKAFKGSKAFAQVRVQALAKKDRVSFEEISIYEFLARHYESCTVQRDTQERLSKALHKQYGHLAVLMALHAVIFVTTVNGRIYQLDGHTRALGWLTGQLMAPSHVVVIHVPCETVAEMEKAYYCFDSEAAKEKTREMVGGAFRANKMDKADFRSKLIQNYGIASALGFLSEKDAKLSKGERFVKTVRSYKKAIYQLDSFGFDKNITAGVVAAGLIILQKEGIRKSVEIGVFLGQMKKAQRLATMEGNFVLYRDYIEKQPTLGSGGMFATLLNLTLYLWMNRHRKLTQLESTDKLKKYVERYGSK